jgi:uncharacterized protein YggE
MNTYIKYLLTSVSLLILIVVTILLLNAAHLSLPLSITSSTRSSELAVTGTGKVDVVPDIAYVDVGITVSSIPTVAEAQQKINTANNKITEEIKKLNISQDDIKTSNYSINPQYDPVKGTMSTNGYTGNANIRIKVRDISQVSKVVETATASGANQIMGVSYSVDDIAKYREQARTKALDNAKEEAKKLSSSLGLQIGKVTNVVENSGGVPGPMMAEKAAYGFGGAADAGANFAPGTQSIESTVTVYFDKQ